MKVSQLFGKTLKDAPKDVENRTAAQMIRAGYIDQTGAGIYTFLPLGHRVLEKINTIIREEMDAIDGQEILMPALHPASLWKTTGRWDVDVMYKTKSQTGQDYGLGWTHEEIVTPLAKKFINSYKDLPKSVYQIQVKFRDEIRAKSGLLRTREFIMKDMYSFHSDNADLDKYYEKVKQAYVKILDRLGIKDKTYLTYASGGDFSKYSHEYQTLIEAGEDIIYVCDKCKLAVNKEIIDEIKGCPECGNKDLKEKKASETANIFKLGNRFTEAFGFKYLDKEGVQQIPVMGCYGFGPSRAMGTVAEALSDDKGLVWPDEIAPYRVYLLSIGEEAFQEASKLSDELEKAGVEVLFDDTNDSAGEKFARADLLGIPVRITVSPKTLETGGFEYKKRTGENSEIVPEDSIIEKIKNG